MQKDDPHQRLLVKKAHKLIYGQAGVSLGSTRVETLLQRTSLVPTVVCVLNSPTVWLLIPLLHQNAFSERLSFAGFDFHEMIVPDIMHENLLGTWKALLVVMLRLLYATNPNKIAEFNQR